MIVFNGEEVKIRTSNGETDPNTYNVQFVKRNLVGLSCKETGILIKVHNKRISKIISQEEIKMNEATVFENVETQTTAFEPAQNVKKIPKAPPQLIDFDQIVKDGFEVWTKSGLNLGDDPKVAGITVAAHCQIDPNDTPNCGYVVFNSYNGTRGKKGSGGKRYFFSDRMTAEKKRKTLEKKGYIKHKI